MLHYRLQDFKSGDSKQPVHVLHRTNIGIKQGVSSKYMQYFGEAHKKIVSMNIVELNINPSRCGSFSLSFTGSSVSGKWTKQICSPSVQTG